MARRHWYRRKHSGGRRRRIRRSRRGVGGLWSRFAHLFKRPVSYVVSPVLGIAALLQIVLSDPGDGYNGSPLVNFFLHVMPGTNQNLPDAQMDVQEIPKALMNGVVKAVPALVGAALTGIVGRIFKI